MVVVDDRTVDSRNGLNALRVDGSCLLLMMQPLSRQTPPYGTAKVCPAQPKHVRYSTILGQVAPQVYEPF